MSRESPRLPCVVLSILEDDADRTAARLAAAPAGYGLIEIRADRLRAAEIAALTPRASCPVIVTVRARRDGGSFDGSEEERAGILDAALASGAAFIDVEWEGPQAPRAQGPQASRVILSHHGAPCRIDTLEALHRAMASTRATLLKIVPRAVSPAEVAAVRDLLRAQTRRERRTASFALGAAGTASRVFAPSWGAWGTYGAAVAGRETAEGQLTATDLLVTYGALRISATTRRFALVGSPLVGSPSPAMHAAGYRAAGLDAVYVPLQSERVEEIESLLGVDGVLGVEAVGVTVPLKEAFAVRATARDAFAEASGAVNTVRTSVLPWEGWNTDAPAALDLVRRHLDPRGARVAIVGAGATAKAIGAALRDAGALPTFYNRSAARGREAGIRLGLPWDSLGALPRAAWDVLVQATPLGRSGEGVLSASALQGRLVLDVVYGPEPTPLIHDARSRGIPTVDGFEMLVAQASLQFERMIGAAPPPGVLEEAGAAWMRGALP